MTEALPATRGSGSLERGGIPEVAALGNALTTLFNTLGMSQSAYAVRVSLDKSVVSRALRGRRVATQDFIDRLVREVESVRGTPVQPEVHSKLRALRLAALRVCDPAVYELESLRAEMEKTQREAELLARHQEALHDLLEKKEHQIARLHAELQQVRQDWFAGRPSAGGADVEAPAEHVADNDSLAHEVARLRAELAEVVAARANAERRCAALETQVREMEEELAARVGEGGGIALPLEILQDQLTAHWETGRTREAARDLTEAALTRPVDELSDLVAWLDHRGDRLHGDHVVREVARVRSVEDVAAFGKRTLDRQWTPSFAHQAAKRAGLLAAEACLVMTPQDIAVLHTLWPDQWDPGTDQILMLRPAGPHSVLAALLESPRGLDDMAQVMARIPADEKAAVRNLHPAAFGRIGEHTLTLLLLASKSEWRELHSLLITDFARRLDTDHVWLAVHDAWLGRMSGEHWRSLTRTLLDSLSLEQFSRVFTGVCKAHQDLLTPQGLGRTPLFVMLQEISDRGLLPDFAKTAGSRPALLPGRRKERALARSALIAWRTAQD
ncbi:MULTISPECIES: hypothetical protein [Streptomyces]|uniref:HTH cro/C1-type domain-containing protein n=1 Tax=Streptomyces canarius TaxID=285453 RepID=A0ABQ3D2A6_9ACTN|nr:hypothetical protein [Streptomyces canarius]GHA49847.1 hypothetical protein GCM10010345_62950 [Streptomyces canarius]